MNRTRIIAATLAAGALALGTSAAADATPRPDRGAKVYVCHRMGAHPVLLHVAKASTTYQGHAHHRADVIEGRDGDAAYVKARCGQPDPEPTATIPTHTPKPTHTRTPCPTHTTVTTPPTSSTSSTPPPVTSSTTHTRPPSHTSTSSTTSSTPPTSAAPSSSSVAAAPPSTTHHRAAPRPVSTTQAAAVVPELAHTGVNGRGIRVLAAIGALLALFGAAALVLSRRTTGSHR